MSKNKTPTHASGPLPIELGAAGVLGQLANMTNVAWLRCCLWALAAEQVLVVMWQLHSPTRFARRARTYLRRMCRRTRRFLRAALPGNRKW